MMNDAEILLVDDSPEAIDFIDRRLRALGYRTRIAVDGAQALEAVRARVPSLVVLDVMMPELNGYQVCRELKRMHPALPVVLLTAKSSDADRFWGLDSGADRFLVKPVDPEVLVALIASLLAGSPR
jgi:DNA-binding response OmpR family regulator